MQKILQYDQISESLTANEFIDLQSQVVALEEKIDGNYLSFTITIRFIISIQTEQNFELKRMRQIYNTNVHVSQHIRECTLTLQEKLRGYRKILMMEERRRRQLRESLHAAKLAHNHLKKQKIELTFQGGLLTMPILMHDYDETAERVLKKRLNIKNMKETLKRLTQRISEISNLADTNKSI